MTTTDPADTVTIRVTINGTTENPWHRYALRCNPFPQTGRHEWYGAEMAIASLDGEPVTSEQDIRDRLPLFAAPFVDLCIAQYRPGERVSFLVSFPADRGER